MYIKLLLILLVCAVFISALQLVIVRHQNRLLFAEWQELQQERERLKEKKGQFQLEQSMLAQYNLIEEKAHSELNMHSPTPQEIIVIKP